MNELKAISQLPETKEQITSYSNAVIKMVGEGNENALEIYERLKAAELTFKTILDGIKDFAYDEAAKYGEKSFDFRNSKVELAQVGVKYDFSGCNDPQWNDAKKNEQEYASKRKARENVLKAIKECMTIIDLKTGEIITINPPSKSGKESIKITLK